MKYLSTLVCLFVVALSFGQTAKTYTPETVPNTKLINNSYVSNPDGILDPSTVDEINRKLSQLEASNSVQVAVVALKSIGDDNEIDFAQKLFELWGIGHTNNNGLLILLVTDLRVVRFHTGYGLEGVLPDVTCKRIQRKVMVPQFKEGNYPAGILAGVDETLKVLGDPEYARELAYSGNEEPATLDYSEGIIFCLMFLLPLFLIVWIAKSGKFADSKPADPTPYPQMRWKRKTWLIAFAGVPVLILIAYFFRVSDNVGGEIILTLYAYLMLLIFYRIWREQKMIRGLMAKARYFEITDYLRKAQWYWIVIALIFPLPFLFYLPFHFSRKRYYRNHPRKCSLCQGEMVKLSETADDQYLTKGQQMEETVRSIDYDVWKCKACSATETWHFINRLSSYDKCPY